MTVEWFRCEYNLKSEIKKNLINILIEYQTKLINTLTRLLNLL